MKKLYWAAFTLLGTWLGYGQQDPHYTQYMYNMSVINPAYAGSKDHLSGGVLYRRQWVEIQDSPSTGTIFLHTPVGKNVGLGVSVINDQIGPVEETNAYADISYTLNLGGEHKLAFGMKAGASFQKIGLFSQIGNGYVPDAGDEAFSQNTSNTFVNIGAGLFYYTDKYYFAFSVPNMLKATHLDANGATYGTETSHFFATAGYVFDITQSFKLKPFVMAKSAFNAPVSFDASLNALFFERLEIGATWRLEDSFGGMIGFQITPGLKLGYAYDHIVSDLNVTTPSSHEFLLLFDLNFPKKVSRSPRYF